MTFIEVSQNIPSYLSIAYYGYNSPPKIFYTIRQVYEHKLWAYFYKSYTPTKSYRSMHMTGKNLQFPVSKQEDTVLSNFKCWSFMATPMQFDWLHVNDLVLFMLIISGPSRWHLLFLSIAKYAGIKVRQLTPDWNQVYGGIVKVHRFGNPLMIRFCNYDLIKEAFVKYGDYFNCRPRNLWLVNQLFKQRGKICVVNIPNGRRCSQMQI